MKTNLIAILLAAGVALSGCATASGPWIWNVTRFHNLDDMRSRSFVIVPIRKEYVDSLEFESYAALVSEKLSAMGLVQRPREEFGKTDYLFVLDYGIGEPYQVNLSYSYPIFGQIAGGSTVYNSTIYSGGKLATVSGTATTQPQYGVVGTESGTRAITNYRQFVHLFVFDGRFSPAGKLARRYEGKAEGAGYLSDLTKIVPSGLKALFTEFPGQSGISKTERFYGLDQRP